MQAKHFYKNKSGLIVICVNPDLDDNNFMGMNINFVHKYEKDNLLLLKKADFIECIVSIQEVGE